MEDESVDTDDKSDDQIDSSDDDEFDPILGNGYQIIIWTLIRYRIRKEVSLVSLTVEEILDSGALFMLE
jgi:hypothetical protein